MSKPLRKRSGTQKKSSPGSPRVRTWGETVVDLGSGAGFDVFTAAKRVGPTGKAIGVDMNKNMVDKANANKAYTNASNVQFIESAITSIPLPDNTVDCIISNCVINLVPAVEKQLVFNEMFRLLNPGGRVAISDILARKEFTEEMKKSIALYVGCIAGASQVSDYEAFLKNAGFADVLIVDSKNDLNVYFTAAEAKTSCSAVQLGITDFNEWAGSFQVYAVKPAANRE
ncbi:hypothetical protein CEP53_002270 [Fusarium sp. AF-6]|nr:hypothetical protein CEP53_002270 [Fusarium sp. AF-6]